MESQDKPNKQLDINDFAEFTETDIEQIFGGQSVLAHQETGEENQQQSFQLQQQQQLTMASDNLT